MKSDEDHIMDNLKSAREDIGRLEKENAELRQQLAAFHAAMEREKKPDWQKWLKDLADRLEGLIDTSRHATYGDRDLGEAARQLRSMADSFTLKANFVPSELRIKELEGNLTAAEKEHERLESEAAVAREALTEMCDFLTSWLPVFPLNDWLVERDRVCSMASNAIGKKQ